MVVSILEVIERGNKINLTEIDLSILIQENVNEVLKRINMQK